MALAILPLRAGRRRELRPQPDVAGRSPGWYPEAGPEADLPDLDVKSVVVDLVLDRGPDPGHPRSS